MKKGSVSDGLVYHAGFPNAAEDRPAISLSLDSLIVGHHASTFYWRVPEPVLVLGWLADTLVVVDRAIPPRNGDVVVLVVDESFVLGRMRQRKPTTLEGKPLTDEHVVIWGVATYAIQALR